eukprot:scaffold156539_cov26-Tisochrysis_lutea.AAC.7
MMRPKAASRPMRRQVSGRAKRPAATCRRVECARRSTCGSWERRAPTGVEELRTCGATAPRWPVRRAAQSRRSSSASRNPSSSPPRKSSSLLSSTSVPSCSNRSLRRRSNRWYVPRIAASRCRAMDTCKTGSRARSSVGGRTCASSSSKPSAASCTSLWVWPSTADHSSSEISRVICGAPSSPLIGTGSAPPASHVARARSREAACARQFSTFTRPSPCTVVK